MPETRRYQIRGIVQGVGFRPFVFRTAEDHSLGGWVRNDSDGVVLEVQGEPPRLEAFIDDVRSKAPALARIESVALLDRRENGDDFRSFEIQASDASARARTLVSPDMGVCEDCLRELFDPGDRRYLYPYINCTNCGPRHTIIRGVPYDRPLTTMSCFPMCEACEREYHDPRDRRFHAQPVACWECGPRVWLRDSRRPDEDPADPIDAAARILLEGAIVAVKGLGGYHLVVDARNEEAVAELRRRKHREEKPLALMSRSLDAVREYAYVEEVEAELLESIARPILLLRRRPGGGIAEGVAPGNRDFGVMLAYTPIHHLLLRDELDTVVATSGNVSDEPIAFEDDDALERLSSIADAFLLGNRRIHTRVDDSIARAVQLGDELVVTPLRRARGNTPEPVKAPFEPPPVLAVGPELKNTICVSRGAELFLSHHIGDLKNAATRRSFEHAIESLAMLLEVKPELLAHDMHPGYLSTAYAREKSAVLPTVAVQHHHAHMAACMCEHGLTEPVLGVIFDGTGYGTDGRIWGGELLVGDYAGFERAAQLEYCPLPGGDRAVEEPFRVALALLHRAHGSFAGLDRLPVVAGRSEEELHVLGRMIEQGVNSPLTSSMGRLFDGISALLGVRELARYDAQAAIELEQLLKPGEEAGRLLEWELHAEEAPMRIDPRPLVRELAAAVERGEEGARELSLRFHCTVLEMVRRSCQVVRERTGIEDVVLSGGVFQNEFLLRGAWEKLREAGFNAYVHRKVPTNDGGVALGQAAIAGWGAR
jgi:hydrogenase maturation protein HypF